MEDPRKIKLKVAAYMRVSKKIGMTVENQRPIIEKWIEVNKDEIEKFDFFTEEESTRKTREIQRMVYEKILSDEYNTLVCVRLDRWGRSVQEMVDTCKNMLDHNARIVFINSNMDILKEGFNATQKLQFIILSAFADYERDIIRERTIEGQARAAAEGKFPGRPKGSKDSKARNKSGYYMRWIKQKQVDRESKVKKKLEEKINNTAK